MRFTTFDPFDLDTLQKLLEKHKDRKTIYSGHNVKGEKCIIIVFPDKVSVQTILRSGGRRTISYWPDGTVANDAPH